MKCRLHNITIITLLVLGFMGCKETHRPDTGLDKISLDSTETNMAVESQEWNALFIRNAGWFGGDGIFGIPLDGKEFVPCSDSTQTLFTFGDTMIGNHNGEHLMKGDFKMINNSFGLLKGKLPDAKKTSFYYKTAQGEPESLFVPSTIHSKAGDYYWLGDGFVNVEGDGNLYVFAYPIQHKDTTGIGGFGFEQIGVNLLKIPLDDMRVDGIPDFEKHSQVETPFFNAEKQTSFGSAIFVNTQAAGAPDPDGYIYTYAVSNKKERKGLLVARVPSARFTAFDEWRFWNGSSWSKVMEEAKHIAWDVSNEMSVSPLPDGSIMLVYQYYTMSREVTVQIGQSLTGPFERRKTIYEVPGAYLPKNYFPYNAKAYPHLSAKDSVLVSYNVNSFDFFNDILTNPNLYRPRFIQVALSDLN